MRAAGGGAAPRAAAEPLAPAAWSRGRLPGAVTGGRLRPLRIVQITQWWSRGRHGGEGGGQLLAGGPVVLVGISVRAQLMPAPALPAAPMGS